MKQGVAKPLVMSVGVAATLLVAGAIWLSVRRADGMVIDLAALAGLAICF
jgi:hypothetical protein